MVKPECGERMDLLMILDMQAHPSNRMEVPWLGLAWLLLGQTLIFIDDAAQRNVFRSQRYVCQFSEKCIRSNRDLAMSQNMMPTQKITSSGENEMF